MRILRIIARMNVGGPALQVVNMMRGLDPARFEQRLLVGEVEPGEADYLALRAPDVDAVRVPGLGRAVRPLDDARALRQIRREIREFRPDVIHTHTAKAGALGRVAAITSTRAPTVHTFHGHLLNGYFGPITTRAVVATERALAWRTTKLLAVGRSVRDDLLAAGIGHPPQYEVIPPGVRLPPLPPREEARAAFGFGQRDKVVSFVARMTAIKRPDRFAAVALATAAAEPAAKFLVAGEGPLLPQLRSDLAQLGERVVFAGWRGDVEHIYAASDLVLLTSDNEGMPVSLIEAALAGCPAVTTDVGSASEVVLDGRGGRVVRREVEELAQAVLELLADRERRCAMGHAARSHAAANFSAERQLEAMAEIYGAIGRRASR